MQLIRFSNGNTMSLSLCWSRWWMLLFLGALAHFNINSVGVVCMHVKAAGTSSRPWLA